MSDNKAPSALDASKSGDRDVSVDKSKDGVPTANLPAEDYKPEDDDDNYESGTGAAAVREENSINLEKSKGKSRKKTISLLSKCE